MICLIGLVLILIIKFKAQSSKFKGKKVQFSNFKGKKIMSVQDLGISVDTVWMLLAAMLVFFMQPGFALCEAGFTRSKNTANILFKNFVDFMIGSVLFWFVGFGFMFGSDGAGFIGMPNFGDLSFYHGDLPTEGFLMFETVFCATSATIVSGAMAERTKFSMYCIYSFFISLIIYPVEGHWTWGGGWLCNADAGDRKSVGRERVF